MKKIFTLLVGAAMIAPMASADDVTINLDTYVQDGQVGPNVASMKGTVTYDEATGLYSSPISSVFPMPQYSSRLRKIPVI